MSKTIRTLALSSSMLVIGALGANAATLDFTALKTFTGAKAISADATGASGMIGGVIWTLTPSTTPMRYNFAKGNGALSGANNGFDGGSKPMADLAFEGDGIGIGNKDDEVTAPGESLTLTFSHRVLISGFHYLDLFIKKAGYETAIVSGGMADSVDATENTNAIGGYKFHAATTPKWVTSLTFTAGGAFFPPAVDGDDGSRDYALAAVDIAAVPVPAAGFMLLTALGGLAAARRRKSA